MRKARRTTAAMDRPIRAPMLKREGRTRTPRVNDALELNDLQANVLKRLRALVKATISYNKRLSSINCCNR